MNYPHAIDTERHRRGDITPYCPFELSVAGSTDQIKADAVLAEMGSGDCRGKVREVFTRLAENHPHGLRVASGLLRAAVEDVPEVDAVTHDLQSTWRTGHLWR